jgi:hypothetical protein
MNKAVEHHYKRFRAHQMSVWSDGGGGLTFYPSGRTELSFGGAPYGEHALSAYLSAKAHINFLARLHDMVQS